MSYKFDKVTVLVVDSQPAIVDLIQGVLSILGVKKVITRMNGKDGLKAFREYQPDLLIIDWDLADMDGLDFTKSIRDGKINPFVPIIFMTAFSSKKRVLKARDSGITEFVAKPFTANALYARIEEIIERPRQFVRTEEFFGPDRRRKRSKEFDGPDKRERLPIEIDFVDSPSEEDDDRN